MRCCVFLLLLFTFSLRVAAAVPIPSNSDHSVQSFATCESVTPCFTIANATFVRDGVPVRLLSGSIHYWRSLPDEWEARLRTAQLAGINTVTMYLHWALHQPEPHIFVLPKDNPRLDFVRFIQIAGSLGLQVIVRVGPYITAEVDFGGFPYWIQKVPGIAIRRPNDAYYALIDAYFDQIIPLLAPLQYNVPTGSDDGNSGPGGPIINFQVEDDTDVPLISDADTHAYYSFLAQGLRKRGIVQPINVLAWPSDASLSKAIIPGCWTALEYACTQSTSDALNILRKYDTESPFMVMEFYPAWMDVEGGPHNTMEASAFSDTLTTLLSATPLASVSIYMIHGGTNFGFTAGSDWEPDSQGFASIITSYDYDTAVQEDGDANPTKFPAIQAVLAKFSGTPIQPIPQPSPKGEYGILVFNQSATLLNNVDLFSAHQTPLYALPFEQLNQSYGFVLYRTQVSPSLLTSPELLAADYMLDRAVVMLNGLIQGVFGWAQAKDPFGQVKLQPIVPAPIGPMTLSILVENKGRCSGTLQDFSCSSKGLVGQVYVGSTVLASGWNMSMLPLEEASIPVLSHKLNWNPAKSVSEGVPTFYRAVFTISAGTPLLHSYLLTDSWGHGVVWLNGFSLGKFSEAGPQRALYVPASILQLGDNEVIVFETDVIPLLKSKEGNDNISPMEFDGTEPDYRTMKFIPAQLWTKNTTDSCKQSYSEATIQLE
jgi:beta-galactosidase